MNPLRPILVTVLFIILITFIWYAGLKPLYINEDINIADRYAKTKKCDKALELMRSDVIYNPSTIDSYAKLKYISVIERCNARSTEAIELLKEVAEIRPYYTRTYLFLGNYTGDKSYFEKASELSPKHEEIFVGKIKIDMASNNYESAQNEAQKCIEINPQSPYCWWLKALSNFHLKESKTAGKDLEIATETGFDFYQERYLSQIEIACELNEDENCYRELFKIYKYLTLMHSVADDYEYYKNYFLDIAEKANKIDKAKIYIKTLRRERE